jgi:hypothetical protein
MRTRTVSNRPPYPPTTRCWTSLRASLAGRRDARSAAIPDPDGHLPFTRRTAALAHAGQTEVAYWLHTQLDPLDRSIAATIAAINHARREHTRLTTDLDTAELAAAAATHIDAARHARSAVRLRSESDAHHQHGLTAETELAALLSTRRHILDQARSAAAAWATRYNRLAANHRRGYLRHHEHPNLPIPALPPFLEWTTGDLPLLVSTINPDSGGVVELTITPFVPATAPAPTALR